MDDMMLDQLSDVELGSFSHEETREATEGYLVPRGRWTGQLQPDSKVTRIHTESGRHPLEGETIVRCHVVLHTDQGEKHFFFDTIGKLVKATSERTGGTYTVEASQNGGFLVAATKLYGRPFVEVLHYAMEHPLIYDIGVKKATDDYPARNTLRGVYRGE